jgi:hypothetical protein
MADFMGLMKQAAEFKSKMEAMQAELEALDAALGHPARPVAAVVGVVLGVLVPQLQIMISSATSASIASFFMPLSLMSGIALQE